MFFFPRVFLLGISKDLWKIRIERRPTEVIYPELNSSLVTKMGLEFHALTLAPAFLPLFKVAQP